MLVQAQDATIAKIDTQYMPKLEAILADIQAAKAQDGQAAQGGKPPRSAARARCQPGKPEDRGRRRQGLPALPAAAARADRQGPDPGDARPEIADNTYETVEASVQLRNLMRDSHRVVRGDPEARGAKLRAHLQERRVASRIREHDAPARRAVELMARPFAPLLTPQAIGYARPRGRLSQVRGLRWCYLGERAKARRPH